MTAARAERRFLAVVVVAGIALRLLWLWAVHGALLAPLGAGEASDVALAFARTGTLADAYFPGQGPTAHLMPLNPALAGLVLRWFGPGSATASLVLLAWSLAQVCASFLVLRAAFARLGWSPAALRWGVALLFLLIPFAPQDTIDFRYWEGGSAMLLAALNLWFIARIETGAPFDRRTIAIAALLSALTFFVSPPVGLAVDLCWALAALRRLPPRRIAIFAGVAALAVAALVTPWALRNAHLLGAPILTRSNTGLELAIADHPAALSPRPPELVFHDRLRAIHPSANPALRALIARPGGEVRYSAALLAGTRAWIAAHPLAFAQLYLRHLRAFVFPAPWQFYFSGWEGMRLARALTVSLIAGLGLLGLARGLWQRRRGYWLPAVYVAGIALPYAAFQPMPRYIYLSYGVFAFLAAALLRPGAANER